MEKKLSWQEEIYISIASKNNLIVPYFKYFYLAILLVLFWGIYSEIIGIRFNSYYQLGVWLGRAALILLGIVVLPGILGRLGIEIRITRLVTVLRRQLGITVFLLAFSHYVLVRAVPYLIGLIRFNIPPPLFELFGSLGLFLLFLMFLTSNNFSTRRLGPWWKRLHRAVYVVLWLLVLHTGLQRISFWSIFIFAFAGVETFSWIKYFLIDRGKKATPVS